MDKRLVNPAGLAKPVGFSHAVRVSGAVTVYLAGQTAQDVEEGIVGAGDIVAQFRQVIGNLNVAAEAAGVDLTDIVKLTIYVTDRDRYKANARAIGEIYREFFGKYYPAMTLVEVKRLWDDAALIEIDGVAVSDSVR